MKPVEEVKPVAQTPVAKEEVPPKKEEAKAAAAVEPVAEAAKDDSPDYLVVEEKLAALKEKGNNQFRKKAYKEAVKHFSEAIKIFEDTGRPSSKGDIKTKITQIYTNRCTSLHLLNQ